MESNHIKDAVNKINRIVNSNDTDFTTNQIRSVATNLLILLNTNFDVAPTTAAAMIQYLTDHGFKVSNLKGEAYIKFLGLFGPRISRFSPTEINQLRKISKKLMLN